ncbi:MAG: hypothetical protein CMF61_07190 [Magnetococcales bacterium]|nr:hypothetical protein [Magnetococcales bacterium]|tara:strand:- start:1982 stop:2317 length:336 start_codon:yes stop_codon:yes gene_type:complete
MFDLDFDTLKRNFAIYITPTTCSLFILTQWLLVNMNVADIHYRLTDDSFLSLTDIATMCSAILISACAFLLFKTLHQLLLGNWAQFRMYFYTLSIYTVSLILAANFYIPPQ